MAHSGQLLHFEREAVWVQTMWPQMRVRIYSDQGVEVRVVEDHLLLHEVDLPFPLT